MRVVWYVGALVLGLLGVLAVARGVEQIVTAAPEWQSMGQAAMGLLFVVVALKAFKKARTA